MTISEPTFFILMALTGQPRHGYGIATEVGGLSEGRVVLAVGTLYGALDRLTRDGLIEVDREEVHSSRLRRYYRLTDSGRQELQHEADRQAANARVAASRLATRPVGAGGVA